MSYRQEIVYFFYWRALYIHCHCYKSDIFGEVSKKTKLESLPGLILISVYGLTSRLMSQKHDQSNKREEKKSNDLAIWYLVLCNVTAGVS